MASRKQLREILLQRQIAELNGIKRRVPTKLPEQKFPRGLQISYAKRLRDYQAAFARIVREILFPMLPDILPARLDQIGDDEPRGDLISRLMIQIEAAIAGGTVALGTTLDVDRFVDEVGLNVSSWQKKQIQRQYSRVLGIDLLQNEPWLGPHLQEFQRSNVKLISKMTETQLGDIEVILRNAKRRGVRHEVIAGEIDAKLKVGKSRSVLIARDQVGKLNGELNQIRQENVGVTSYIWRTSQDERVRGDPSGKYPDAIPSHFVRDGVEYQWNDPPEGGHPGEAIQCRCFAEPVLHHLTGEPEKETKPLPPRSTQIRG